jgi:hypothetical protein
LTNNPEMPKIRGLSGLDTEFMREV